MEGPCPECGQSLPLGTQRYCVHCGADVEHLPLEEDVALLPGATTARSATPEAAVGSRRPTTWSFGDFRAPAPTDGHGLSLQPEAPAGVEWNGPGEATVVLSAEAVAPAAPPAGASWFEGAAVGPRRLEISYPPDGPEQEAGQAPPTGPVPVPAPQGPPVPASAGPILPAAVPPPIQPPVIQPPANAGPWAQPPGWSGAVVAAEPARSPRRAPILIAAAVVLIAVTGGALLWMRSQHAADLAASPAAAPVVSTAASVSSPAATVTSAGPASPGVSSGMSSGAGDVASSASAVASTSGGAAFGAALNGLLDESSSTRADVSATVASLQVCRTSPAQAAAALRTASASRSSLASRAGLLDSAGVAGGADAVMAFVTMEQASAQADDAFANWADEVASAGCRSTAPHTADWAAGNQHSAEATAAKSRFVSLWNPIAAADGLSARTTDEL